MALTTLEGGMGSTIIKYFVQLNFDYLVTLSNGNVLASELGEVAGEGITEFRLTCNANFAVFNADTTISGLLTLEAGDQWWECREKLNTNFTLAAAAMGAHSASASPSGSPSTSPSAGTPSDTPSGSPSTSPSTSPSAGTPSDTPSGSPSSSPSSSPSAS